jgi:hypothetical protein
VGTPLQYSQPKTMPMKTRKTLDFKNKKKYPLIQKTSSQKGKKEGKKVEGERSMM